MLDALGIRKAVFAGHSLAGSELSRLGAAYGSRVEKLIYIDASDLAERFGTLTEPPGSQALFTDATLKSLQAYQAASARYLAVREPDQAVCLNLRFDAKGRVVAATSPDWVTDKLLAGIRAPANPPTDWDAIKAPRLGIFAVFTRDARQAWYWYLSPADQAKFDAAWPPIVDWFRRTEQRFADGNQANTDRLPGAPHYIYIMREAEVVRWMREFLGIPPRQ